METAGTAALWSSPWEPGLLAGASCHLRVCFHTAHLLTLYSDLCVGVCMWKVSCCSYLFTGIRYILCIFFLLELPKI